MECGSIPGFWDWKISGIPRFRNPGIAIPSPYLQSPEEWKAELACLTGKHLIAWRGRSVTLAQCCTVPDSSTELSLSAILLFSALHGMQTRSSDEIFVCLSVCPSKACIVTKRKKDLSTLLCHTKDHLA